MVLYFGREDKCHGDIANLLLRLELLLICTVGRFAASLLVD